MTTRRISWLILGPAAVLAAVAGFWLARQLDSSGPALASGTWLPQARPIADFRMTDTEGHPFTPGNLLGKTSLVFFGFTHCPDVCPTTLVKLAQVKKAAHLPGLQVLFVTVDPQRDTPAALAQYVHAFDSDFIGLTGEPAELTRVTAEFGVATSRVELPGGDYTMDHSAAVFLLDPQARMVGVFTPPFDVQQLARDLTDVAPYLRKSS